MVAKGRRSRSKACSIEEVDDDHEEDETQDDEPVDESSVVTQEVDLDLGVGNLL